MRRTGSQNDIGIPIRGGSLQKQIGVLGVLVSSGPLATWIPAIVIGNKHFQQMSVMGFTNRPTQSALSPDVLRIRAMIPRIKRLKEPPEFLELSA
jgi:hypothetical protein